MSSMTTLQLYRQILKATKTFPSKNKNGLYKEIQLEFRENSKLTKQEEVEKKRAHRAGDAGDDARARKGWEARENEKAIGLALGGEDGEDAGARGARAMDARGIWSTDDVLMFYRA